MRIARTNVMVAIDGKLCVGQAKLILLAGAALVLYETSYCPTRKSRRNELTFESVVGSVHWYGLTSEYEQRPMLLNKEGGSKWLKWCHEWSRRTGGRDSKIYIQKTPHRVVMAYSLRSVVSLHQNRSALERKRVVVHPSVSFFDAAQHMKLRVKSRTITKDSQNVACGTSCGRRYAPYTTT